MIRNYQPGDLVRVRNRGVGSIVALRAQTNSRGNTEVQYKIRVAGEEATWVSETSILGICSFAPRIVPQVLVSPSPPPQELVRERPSKAKKRLRQRPSKQKLL